MRSWAFVLVGEAIGATFPATLAPLGNVLAASTGEEATRILIDQGRSLTGLFADVVLADGSGFDVLERTRALGMEIPALVGMPRSLGLYLNRAALLGAACLPAPVVSQRIVTCVKRWDKAAGEDEAADELFRQNHAAETGMSADEVSAHIRGILEKTGCRTMAAVLRRFRRDVAEQEEYRRRTGEDLEDPSTRH